MTTAQDIFNAAFLGVWKQGRRSYNPVTGCQYRSENGDKCAVGHVITDDEYKIISEGVAAPAIAELVPRLLRHESLITRLQIAHDQNRFIGTIAFRARWELDCAQIAMRYDLKMPDLPDSKTRDVQSAS